MKILTVENKKEEKFLRKKTTAFDFAKYKKSEIRELIKTMHGSMKEANGIGLSANQIGLDLRFFIVELPPSNQFKEVRPPEINRQYLGGRTSHESKFYAIFNPEIKKTSKEKISLEEGCLSVPNTYGMVERPEKITLEGFDKNGKKLKIKAWGLLARVFQHEADHLNGILFIDKATNIVKIEKTEGKVQI